MAQSPWHQGKSSSFQEFVINFLAWTMGIKISRIGCYDKAIYLVLTLSLNNIFFSVKFTDMYVLKT